MPESETRTMWKLVEVPENIGFRNEASPRILRSLLWVRREETVAKLKRADPSLTHKLSPDKTEYQIRYQAVNLSISELRKAIISSPCVSFGKSDFSWPSASKGLSHRCSDESINSRTVPILRRELQKHRPTEGDAHCALEFRAAMNSILGIEFDGELFSPLNGLLLPSVLEEVLESGFITIVPDIPNNASSEDRQRWRMSNPKDYMFPIIDKPSPDWVPGLLNN